MKVFSNTTPLIALSAINQLELLPRLFEQIYLTDEVMSECAAKSNKIDSNFFNLSSAN